MRKTLFLICILTCLALLTFNCKKELKPKNTIVFKGFKERSVEITASKSFTGWASNYQEDTNQLFIQEPAKGGGVLRIVDAADRVLLAEQSLLTFNKVPTDRLFSLVAVQYNNGRYMVADTNGYVQVLNKKFGYLYGQHFGDERSQVGLYFSFDFYHHDGKIHFVAAEKKRDLQPYLYYKMRERFLRKRKPGYKGKLLPKDFQINFENNTQLYLVKKTRRRKRTGDFQLNPDGVAPPMVNKKTDSKVEKKNIEFVKHLHTYVTPSYFNPDNSRLFYRKPLYFSPMGKAFEKDGKIFYSCYDENLYYVYYIDEGVKREFQLSYLKPKRFTQKDAEKATFYKFGAAFPESYGKKHKSSAHAGEIYHLGIYDVGEEKVGIVGSIDLDNFTLRMDIIDSESGEYLESLQLPFGYGFLYNLSNVRQVYRNHIFLNMDNGIYAYNDAIKKQHTRVTTIK